MAQNKKKSESDKRKARIISAVEDFYRKSDSTKKSKAKEKMLF